MTTRAQREAFLIANHADDDTLVAGIVANANAAIPPGGTPLVPPAPMFPDSITSGWIIDTAGVQHFYVVSEDDTGAQTTTYYTGADRATTTTPTGRTYAPDRVEFDQIEGANELLTVTDGAVVTLTVPADAIGAYIQVQDADIRVSNDGTTPTPTVGEIALENATIDVATTPYIEGMGDIMELGNFRAIAFTGETAKIEVQYFRIRP